MTPVGWIRALFATSLGFHVIFATLGVGMPLFILLAESAAKRRQDPLYRLMARRWAGAFLILLGTGVVSGTIVAVQLQLLWPPLVRLVGQIIALPFAIEVMAFFLEAIFAAAYLWAGDRLSATARIWAALGVTVGAGFSALLITDVNAFMNTPAGFRVVGGQVADIHPWRAMFNPAMPTELIHVLITAYLAVALVLGAFAAAGALRARGAAERAFRRRELSLTTGVAAVMGALAAITGDLSGKFLAGHQPMKLAAAEGLFHSGRSLPLTVGGIVDPATRTVNGAVHIPYLLSWLATGSIHGYVRGLDTIARADWPPVVATHLLFDLMVGIGILAFLATAGYWLWQRWQVSRPASWILIVLVVFGPLGLAGIECGWVFAELARQPWTITGVLTTAAAATTAPGAAGFFAPFVALYVALAIGAALALRKHFRDEPLPEAEELSAAAIPERVAISQP